MTDVIGRRKCMMLSVIATMTLSLLYLAVPIGTGFYPMLLLRFAVGLPYGGILVNQYAFPAEFLPDFARGFVGSATNFGWSLCHIYLMLFLGGAQHTSMPWRSILAFAPLGP